MEEFKKKGYYPAGGRAQTSSAGSITYINANSGLTAGNVQDAIDEVAGNVASIIRLPDAPESDGVYVLTCTVASGEATYTWEAQGE